MSFATFFPTKAKLCLHIFACVPTQTIYALSHLTDTTTSDIFGIVVCQSTRLGKLIPSASRNWSMGNSHVCFTAIKSPFWAYSLCFIVDVATIGLACTGTIRESIGRIHLALRSMYDALYKHFPRDPSTTLSQTVSVFSQILTYQRTSLFLFSAFPDTSLIPGSLSVILPFIGQYMWR